MQVAVTEAIAFQRNLKDQEELDARVAIVDAGGEIVELTPEERQMFIDAVTPIYAELRDQYSPKLRELVGIN